MATEPYYASERCFRHYEPYITAAIAQWPKIIRFTTEKSPATDAARCRDALAGWRKNRWTCAFNAIANDQFKRIGVKYTDFAVYVGSKVILKQLNIESPHVAEAQGMIVNMTNAVEDEVAQAMAKAYDPSQQIASQSQSSSPQVDPYLDLDLPEIINLIDSGQSSTPYDLPYSEENMLRVQSLCEGRINIAFVHVKQNETIHIF
jgi:hypothetical protein